MTAAEEQERRRAFLVGGWALALGGTAALITPHAVPSEGPEVLDGLAPLRLADWRRNAGDGVVPETAGDDRERLDRTLAFTYKASSAASVTALFAYHAADSTEVKVHRPEVCYQVAGFRLSQERTRPVRLSMERSVPARFFRAERAGEGEEVLYWSRVGDAFPTSLAAQRWAALQAGLHGRAVDGLLVRFSTATAATASATLQIFAATWFAALSPKARAVLL